MPKLGRHSFPEWASGSERLVFPEWSFRGTEGLLESVAIIRDLNFYCRGDGFPEDARGKTGVRQGSTCSI
jgi:hypothetical protein